MYIIPIASKTTLMASYCYKVGVIRWLGSAAVQHIIAGICKSRGLLANVMANLEHIVGHKGRRHHNRKG